MPELPLRRHTEALAGLLRLDGSARVLDAGCGDGGLVAWLRRRGAEAYGLDVGEVALRVAAGRLAGTSGLVAGEGERLPFGASAFGAVVYLNSFHHLPTAAMAGALAEARRALTPAGRLVVIEPLAEGDYFELLRPVEDETAARAAAAAALGAAGPPGWSTVERFDYAQAVEVASVDDLIDRFRRADPARAPALEREHDRLRGLFERLGAALPEGGGRSFLQPFRLVALERLGGPEVAIAGARRRDDRRAAFAIRRAVFVQEQGVPGAAEFDAEDASAPHLLARVEGQPAGTLRWRRLAEGAVKIERVAVLKPFRARRIGTLLMREALRRLDADGVPLAVLSSQETAVGFYEPLGFAPEGEPFVEDGILHRRMTRHRPL